MQAQAKKPLIIYVDDEPHNLTVFEASLGDDWDIKTFTDPVKALTELKENTPSVIVSDQRMPHMTGVAFLELARQLKPESVRIVVTGYSDEDLIVEAVRKAGIYDYIKKPWDIDDLKASIERAIGLFEVEAKQRYLLAELQKSQLGLKTANEELKQSAVQLELYHLREKEMRQELECWVPPAVLYTIQNNIKFPIKTDLVGLSFDIIGSSQLHQVRLDGKLIRAHIIQAFTECVLKHRGWRESTSGDSAYAHFGAIEKIPNEADAALAAAREFRVALRGLSQACGRDVEAGISLHVCGEVTFDLHTVHLNTFKGTVTQKSFDTSAPSIDVLHRIEKLVHKLPGTNIVMSDVFKNKLSVQTHEQLKDRLRDVGKHKVAGSDQAHHLFILPSDAVKEEGQALEKILSGAA